jgi:hypothetical protein
MRNAYDNVTTDGLGLRVNTKTFAVSQYSNFNFNSMCFFNGVLLGANASGLFELEGDNDDGTVIDAYFQLPSYDYETPKQKNFRKIYLEGEAEGNLTVTPVVDDVAGITQIVEAIGTDAERQYVLPASKEDRGSQLGLIVSNKDGSDFTVNAVYGTVTLSSTLPTGYSGLCRGKIVLPELEVVGSGS